MAPLGGEVNHMADFGLVLLSLAFLALGLWYVHAVDRL
jgi:hypothetical protein